MSDDSKNDLAFTRERGATGSGPEHGAGEATYSGALSFARRLYSKDLSGCDVAVVGAPFDLATSGRPGARFGPRAVREASAIIAWDRIWGWDFDPFDALSVIDYGDLMFDYGAPANAPEELEAQFRQIHERNVATLTLGGDHFISYPVLKSIARQHDQPLSLIHFDAHSDTWFDDSDRVDHGTMFYHAAKQGLVAPERSAQIGIRTNNEDTHGFNIFEAEKANALGSKALAEQVRAIVGDAPVYLTFDIDCLDPAYAPGTGTPVAGGLTSMQAFEILRELRGVNVVSADVVEVSPSYDVSEITALSAATIGLHCLALMAAGKREQS